MQAVENKAETSGCDHKLYMPVSKSHASAAYAQEFMARLKAYWMAITAWEKNPKTRFCCYFAQNQKEYFDALDLVKPQYYAATKEQCFDTYDKTLEKLKSTASYSGVKLKAERGVYNDD